MSAKWDRNWDCLLPPTSGLRVPLLRTFGEAAKLQIRGKVPVVAKKLR
jgi:hypothetical protein